MLNIYFFFFRIWSWNTYIVSIIRLQIVSQNLPSLLNRALGFSRNISWTWLWNMVISSFISLCWPFKHIFEVYQQGSKLPHKETFCHLLMLIFYDISALIRNLIKIYPVYTRVMIKACYTTGCFPTSMIWWRRLIESRGSHRIPSMETVYMYMMIFDSNE